MPLEWERTIKHSRQAPASKAKTADGRLLPQWSRLDAVVGLPGGTLADGEHYQGFALTGGQFAGQKAQKMLFEQVHLKRVDLSHTCLPETHWCDARLEGCDLSSVEWEKARLRRVEFIGCRLVGARLLDVQLDDALFRDCQGDLALLWSAVCQRVRFEQTRLREASFVKADLAGVVFAGCDLEGADLRDARLLGADFRHSKLNGMQVGLRELRGAIIDSTQAIYVAGLTGVVIQDDPDHGYVK